VSDRELYWWKMPDDEPGLMALKAAEIRCYMVVSRAIQQDRNKGRISVRQVANRARVSLRHAHAALGRLVELGWLCRVGRAGATTTFDLPHGWKGSNCIPTGKQLTSDAGANCFPTGEQLEAAADAEGKHNCFPMGERKCFPTGKQHLDSLDPLEPSSSSNRQRGRSGDTGATTPVTTTKAQWSIEACEQLGDRLQAVASGLGRLELWPPSAELIDRIQLCTLGPEDADHWLDYLRDRRPRVKRSFYGLCWRDVETWERQREASQREKSKREARTAEAVTAKAEREAAANAEYEALAQKLQGEQEARQEFIEAATAAGWKRLHSGSNRCDRCHGFGRRDLVSGEICDCISGRALRQALEHCALCDDNGIAGEFGECDWCTCIHAERRRKKEPEAVRAFNPPRAIGPDRRRGVELQ
jgi:hypothetical protein